MPGESSKQDQAKRRWRTGRLGVRTPLSGFRVNATGAVYYNNERLAAGSHPMRAARALTLIARNSPQLRDSLRWVRFGMAILALLMSRSFRSGAVAGSYAAISRFCPAPIRTPGSEILIAQSLLAEIIYCHRGLVFITMDSPYIDSYWKLCYPLLHKGPTNLASPPTPARPLCL